MTRWFAEKPFDLWTYDLVDHCTKMNLFSKCDQIRRKVRIWSHLLKKSLVENIFCAINSVRFCGFQEKN